MTITLARDKDAPTDAERRMASPLAIRGLTVSYGQKPAVFRSI